jgi:hypothetical protein
VDRCRARRWRADRRRTPRQVAALRRRAQRLRGSSGAPNQRKRRARGKPQVSASDAQGGTPRPGGFGTAWTASGRSPKRLADCRDEIERAGHGLQRRNIARDRMASARGDASPPGATRNESIGSASKIRWQRIQRKALKMVDRERIGREASDDRDQAKRADAACSIASRRSSGPGVGKAGACGARFSISNNATKRHRRGERHLEAGLEH